MRTHCAVVQFIFLSDQHLYSKRWESVIASRDQLDIVQVLTWNDYGESHYIGPIKGDQPDSESWTDGMDHTGEFSSPSTRSPCIVF
jgi:glucan endo-1,3-alpha-glucosidase